MKWNMAWSYLPIEYNTTIGMVENVTQRTFFWNNLNGSRVKVRFSNRYGWEPLVLDKVVIGQKSRREDTISAMQAITRNGEERITIGPGEEFYSDELEWNVTAGMELVLSVYLGQRTNVQSACATWSAKSWHTVYGAGGDYTRVQKFAEKRSRDIYPYVEADANKADIIVGVSEIKLFSEDAVRTIALFGDSITHMSYYADALMERLYGRYPGKVTVCNRGIGGNRLLHDATLVKDMPGEGRCFGTAGVMRFGRDLYETDAPEYILLLEGVNDMMHPEYFDCPGERVTAEELAAGVTEVTETAHRHGSRIYLGTVMPFWCDTMPLCPRGEQVRTAYNTWVRMQNVSDGIFDFAKAVERQDAPRYMRDELHIGDGLHPNAAGGSVMAEVVLEERIKRCR